MSAIPVGQGLAGCAANCVAYLDLDPDAEGGAVR